jgi:hypothetical protein
MQKLTSAFVSLLGAAALLAGCSDSTKLSLSARTGSATAPLAAGTSAQPLNAGPGVTLSRVRMVIAQIKLDPASDGGSSDGGSSSDGGVAGEETVAGPFLIDLSGAALDGGLVQVFQVDFQPGDFRKLKFKIHKLEDGDTRFAGMARLSIIVEGTYVPAAGGAAQPFTFTSSLDEEQEREGTFTLTADATSNLTLAIDTSGWFSNAGSLIDPVQAQNGTLRSEVERNIKGSIDAFDDDDRNGRR